MSQAWKYMSAYQKLTDGVLDHIMMSNETGLETSKNLLSRIHNRDLYKCVYESPPKKVFISICYFKIDGTEMPTTLMLLPWKSWRNASFSFCQLSRPLMYRFCLFLRFWYLSLELFRWCGMFCFSFQYYENIDLAICLLSHLNNTWSGFRYSLSLFNNNNISRFFNPKSQYNYWFYWSSNSGTIVVVFLC
jgi:hypothetical protein